MPREPVFPEIFDVGGGQQAWSAVVEAALRALTVLAGTSPAATSVWTVLSSLSRPFSADLTAAPCAAAAACVSWLTAADVSADRRDCDAWLFRSWIVLS